MATTKISVYRNNKPASNVKVTLEYTGFTNMGFTAPCYTNSEGIAFVEHSSSGRANVYLDGKMMKEGISTPGHDVLHL